MASYILRIIAVLYLVTSSEGTLLFHPIGGAIAAATAGKVFFTGAIIAAAGAIAVGAFHKALEDFWNQQLGPNTQMPKAIKDCMNGDVNMKGGAKVDVDSFIRFTYYVDPKTDIYVDINFTNSIEFPGGGLGGGLSHGSQASTNQIAGPDRSQHGPSRTSATDRAKSNGAPLGAPKGATNGDESAKVASIEDSVTSLFFTEEDLSLGKKINIHFTKSTNVAPFLPRDMVDKLSLNLKNFNEILNQFNLTANSTEAKIMKETLKYCDDDKPGDKCCNSLESMVEFATSIVGKSVKAISNNVEKDSKMEYKVQGVKKLPCGPQAVTCHKIPFPCAVFYCLKVEKMVVYVAKLEGSDGSTINAPAVCHEITNSWDHNHLVLKNLQAKLGSGPICHFLLDDDVLWIAK